MLTFRRRETDRERIARVKGSARTHGVMGDHTALGVDATNPNTRVHALAIDTGTISMALGVDNALGSARGRSANVTRLAGAPRDATLVLALREGPTG